MSERPPLDLAEPGGTGGDGRGRAGTGGDRWGPVGTSAVPGPSRNLESRLTTYLF